MPTVSQPLTQAMVTHCIQWLCTVLSYGKLCKQDSSLMPVLAFHCTAITAQSLRNNFVKYSCLQSWRYQFIHPSPKSAAHDHSCRVSLPRDLVLDQLLHLLQSKSDELATVVTEIAPGDFARSILECAQTNYSVSKTVMWNTTAEGWHTSGKVHQHRKGGQITSYRNSCFFFFYNR